MANALIPNQNILNRRGYSDEGIDLSLYQDRTGYGLAQLDPYGRVQIGGDPGLQEYLNYLAAPQTREVMGNVLADTIPVSAQGQAIERLKQQYTDLQNAQSPIQAAVRAADMGLEGGALVADVLPYGKAAVAGGGALAALMARRTAPLTGMATAPQAANQLGMTGWHGSPHKFDRFDHSNMGSGEGAQAYGWGTYIAENPDVAQSYRVNIGSPSKEFYIGGKVIPKNDIRFGIADDILSHGETKARIHAKANGPEFLRAFEEIKGKVQGDRAHLYEVDLPDEKIAQMLDWDAPLSEQPESVRKAIDALAAETPDSRLWEAIRKHDMRGEHIYERIVGLNGGAGSIGGDMRASQQLNQLGIPGIKYFDGNSRGAGQGTRNFVVFDENDMKILTRNGEEIAQSADSLPMDEASRMARAKEMRFDMDNVYYHGTGNDIEKFNSDLGGVYFTDDPSYADRYTTRNGESGRNIIPVYLKKEAVFDTRKPEHRKIYEEKFLNKYGNGTPIKEDGLPDWVESHDFQEFFKEENLPFDAAIVGEPPDLMPDGTYKNKSSLLITKEENIRSKFAKFDPAKKNSANLLAGGAAAALGLNYLAEPERKEYVTR